jgi:glycosyltransferase involved in cell wall biosynthesis
MSKVPKVSIITVTYNQEQYIAQTVESIVSQKTNFDIEVLVADDKSTDGTADIVRDLANKYPTKIVPILRNKNIGVAANFIETMKAAKGDYIALCEGDDYWTDVDKLQKQAEILDNNSNAYVCFHPVKVVSNRRRAKNYISPDPKIQEDYTLDNLVKHNFIQTNSVMYRRIPYANMPVDILPVDWYLHLYHAKKGQIVFINDVMSVYRKHPGGVWWGSDSDSSPIWRKHGIKHIKLFIELEKLFKDIPDYAAIYEDHINQSLQKLMHSDNTPEHKITDEAINTFYDKITGFIYFLEKVHNESVDKQQKHMNEQADIIRHLQGELTDRDKQLDNAKKELHEHSLQLQAIHNSRSWKVASSFINLKRRIKS